MNQLAVGHAIVARGGADALDPQPAKIALACAAVAIGVPQRAVHRLLGRPEKFALCEEEALRMFQELLAPGSTLGAAFDSGHASILLVRPVSAITTARLMAQPNLVGRQTRPRRPQDSASSRTGLSQGTRVMPREPSEGA